MMMNGNETWVTVFELMATLSHHGLTDDNRDAVMGKLWDLFDCLSDHAIKAERI